jgi:rare lipoprotein A
VIGPAAENRLDRHSASTFEQKWLEQPYIASVLIIASALFLASCGSTPKRTEPLIKAPTTTSKSGGYYLDDGPGDNLPSNLEQIPDAIPRTEALHRGANRPYTIFGKTYVPNVSVDAFHQSGVASWYGKKFHGQKTSIGEIYDMYGMSAAHPTLPLPSYVRVTNPANAKSVVVRVNDRGPFHADRIIDLSYVAAAKLDIARRGSAMVTVERVFAGETTPPPVMATAAPVVAPTVITTSTIFSDADAFYLQLGAFSSFENADIFRERMTRELDWNRDPEWNRKPIAVANKDGLYRVRLGPYKTRDEAEAAVANVKQSHDFSPLITKP